MKRSLAVVAVCAAWFYLGAADSGAQNIGVDDLVNGTWTLELGGYGTNNSHKIHFMKNDSFYVDVFGESLQVIKGTFTLAGSALSLEFYQYSSYDTYQDGHYSQGVPGSAKLKRTACSLSGAEKTFPFRAAFICDNKFFIYNGQDIVPAGTKVAIGSINAVAMGMKRGRILKNARIRELPSTSAKAYEYNNDEFCFDGATKQFIPAGTEIVVLARTAQKEKVENWDNYWYYVNNGAGCGKARGWVYGELLEIVE